MNKKVEKIPTEATERGGYQKLIETLDSVGEISIKPYIDPNKDNMGLTRYNMVLFPHTKYTEELTCKEFNGSSRYITGLDEFAPEVMKIKDDVERESKIKTIREVVSYLEKTLASNEIEPDDVDFWKKVKLVKSDNITFWSKIKIELSNEIKVLKPKDNPNDLILYMAIEAGGFTAVAKSYEDAKNSPVEKKFYLDKRIVTASNRVTYKQLRNKAIAILDELMSENKQKLFYIGKILDKGNSNYKKNTPMELIYDFLDDYINAASFERNKEKAAEDFINVSKSNIETLKLRAIIKDALFNRVIVTKPDGTIYHMTTNSFLGKNTTDVLAYMQNVTNEDIMKMIINETEKFW